MIWSCHGNACLICWKYCIECKNNTIFFANVEGCLSSIQSILNWNVLCFVPTAAINILDYRDCKSYHFQGLAFVFSVWTRRNIYKQRVNITCQTTCSNNNNNRTTRSDYRIAWLLFPVSDSQAPSFYYAPIDS